MITRRTKLQLVVFVVITLLGVSYVGARYAQLDRYFVDDSYAVTAHFPDSGGIFDGGTVTYRGVNIGRVDELKLTDEGVDVRLKIQNQYDDIPRDTFALVGNGSAVGEQYVELQPRTKKGPYLEDGSEIAASDTGIPLSTDELLTNLSNTVESVPQDALRTTVDELDQAFSGTGVDLENIIDTTNSFIATANDNFDVTTALIRDSNTVLRTQIGNEDNLRTFARELGLFSDTLVASDPDLRRLIRTGSLASIQLRQFIIANRIDLAQLISRLVTTGRIVVKHLPGIEQTLVVYPFVVEGGFTVVAKSPDTGLYDAHFGAIITSNPICKKGYDPKEERDPVKDIGDKPMDLDARCAEAASQSNARGAQHAPGAEDLPINNRAPVDAYLDSKTGKLVWGAPPSDRTSASVPAPASLGADGWTWLLMQPLAAR